MNNKSIKRIVFISVIILVGGFSLLFILPNILDQIRGFQSDLDVIINPQEQEKKPLVTDGNNIEENHNPIDIHNYREDYWSSIEIEKTNNPKYINELLKNMETVVDSASCPDCIISYDDVGFITTLKYTVKDVHFTDNISDYNIKREMFQSSLISKYLNNEPVLPEEYKYAVIDIVVTNCSKDTIFDIPFNCFSYYLVDDTYTAYCSEFSYGTTQPGKNTHGYFIHRLEENESMETSAIFVIPCNVEFDSYHNYILFDPLGVGDFSPSYVAMISVDDYIKNSK